MNLELTPKIKNIIEKNKDYILYNQWDLLSIAIGPNNMAKILPFLINSGVKTYPIIEDFKDVNYILSYLEEIGESRRTPDDVLGYFAEYIKEGTGASEDIIAIAKLAQVLGFNIYYTQNSGWYGSKDYLILNPHISLKKYVEDFNSEMNPTEFIDPLDFTPITL